MANILGESSLTEKLEKIQSRFLASAAAKKGAVKLLLTDGITPLDFGVLVFFSAAIATLGLIADIPAVVIGAQLIDPIILPILALSLAYITGKTDSMMGTGKLLLYGVLGAVACAALISVFAYTIPRGIYSAVPFEVMERTKVSFFDLAIAAFGGAAAAYASVRPRLSLVNSGVAIATAIMPPLCAMGIGLSVLSPAIVLGAFLHFLVNVLAIGLAAALTYAFLGFLPAEKKKAG